MTYSGHQIFYIALRPYEKTAIVGGLEYNSVNHQFSNLATNSRWSTDNASGLTYDQKYTILLSDDETTVFTFTTGIKHGRLNFATNCRMDVFSVEDMTVPFFSKGERDFYQR